MGNVWTYVPREDHSLRCHIFEDWRKLGGRGMGVGVGRGWAQRGKAGLRQAGVTIYSDDSLGTYATLS